MHVINPIIYRVDGGFAGFAAELPGATGQGKTVQEVIEEILIADSHASGENIPYDITQMDDRIYLISGFPRAFYMMPAMDPGYDRVLFIGYHAGSGAVHGVMDHTYSGSVIMSLKINGVAMSECTLNLGYAWNVHGVPMAFVLGDEALKQQLEKFLKGQLPGLIAGLEFGNPLRRFHYRCDFG